ncbi:MAG: riboflavin synthase [Parcubacteria group bacterium Greene0714_7]|nr:MAG: riboflavin synthase [Parcubacteria group bacterium Greene0714_7]
MPETVLVTNVGKLKTKDIVNIERSLTLRERLDGHIVQGHIDTTGTIARIFLEGAARVIVITLTQKKSHFMRFVVPKGSIAIEGISLTVVTVTKRSLTVKVLPYTWGQTNLHTKIIGDAVNIEFDIMVKYLERLMDTNVTYATKK